jgi:hypothetical protein
MLINCTRDAVGASQYTGLQPGAGNLMYVPNRRVRESGVLFWPRSFVTTNERFYCFFVLRGGWCSRFNRLETARRVAQDWYCLILIGAGVVKDYMLWHDA